MCAFAVISEGTVDFIGLHQRDQATICPHDARDNFTGHVMCWSSEESCGGCAVPISTVNNWWSLLFSLIFGST